MELANTTVGLLHILTGEMGSTEVARKSGQRMHENLIRHPKSEHGRNFDQPSLKMCNFLLLQRSPAAHEVLRPSEVPVLALPLL